MQLDSSQSRALRAIADTLGSNRSHLTVGGYAGTGKSLVAKLARDEAQKDGVRVAVASFTGKAVDVLRRKGIHDAQTLHRLMYDYDPRSQMFTRRDELEYDAVIVDEASMVNNGLYADLKAFGVPVVWIGDHGQLEPIGDNPNLMQKPDLVLEHIYRQEKGSAILDVAHAFREGRMPNWKAGKGVARITSKQANETILDFDVVLCGKNATRHNINQFIRRRKGFVLPVNVGETLICLRNNHGLAVYNGMLLTVKAVRRQDSKTFHLDLEEVGTGRTLTDAKCIFTDGQTSDIGLPSTPRDTLVVDYGYALSIHKAQGSSWRRVLVFEERGSWDQRRWAYTGATRAEQFLAWTR